MNKLIYTPATSLMDIFFNETSAIEKNYNIIERKNEWIVELIAPGYNKRDFTISVDGKYLKVSVTKEKKEETTDDRYLSKSYVSGSFSKTFILNSDADFDNIKANYENGILYITIPKSKSKLNKQIEVM